MATTSGTFTSPGLSNTFIPPAPNAPFFVQLCGDGALTYMMQSINGEAFALMYQPGGKTPVMLHSPGGTQITPDYVAPGDPPIRYQLSCSVIRSTPVDYLFSQGS